MAAKEENGNEQPAEMVGPPSSLFRATLLFPVRDPLDSVDDGWQTPPSPPPAERSTMPAPSQDLAASGTIELSASVLESERETALAYAALHGSLVPAKLPADLGTAPHGGELELEPGWAERDTVRPPAAPDPVKIELAAVTDRADRLLSRAERAEAALAQAQRAEQARLEAVWREEQARSARRPAELRLQQRSFFRRVLVPVIVSNLAVAAAVGVIGRVTARRPVVVLAPRVAETGRSPLATPTDELPTALAAQTCATQGASRVLAARGEVGVGLDVSPLDSGFALGLASGALETVALRLEGTGLRITERVRTRTPATVQRVAVDSLDDDGLEVHVDSDEARTVVARSPFRIAARGGAVTLSRDGIGARPLWALPPRTDVRVLPPPPPPKTPAFLARLEGTRTNFDRKARTGKDVKSEPLKPIVISPPESVRAAVLGNGGAIVALRRPSLLLVGLVDGGLKAAGNLLPIARKAQVGATSVAAAAAGGVVVWSEKAGAEQSVVAALVGFDGTGPRIDALETLGRGTTPAVKELPDGDLLVAWTETAPGGHRILAARFAPDLAPRGEPIVVSPEGADALQPALAVRPDGSALVAFFAPERGKAAVVATPLACD